MDIKAAKKYLEVMRRAIDLFEKAIDGGELPALVTAAQVTPERDPEPEIDTHRLERQTHIKALMDIDCWPAAVISKLNEQEITTTDLIDRARACLDSCLMSTIDKLSVLDFGCASGYIAKDAIWRGAKSYGFDIKEFPEWKDPEGVIFTTNIEDFTNEMFDVIFLFDVIDHCVDAENIMRQVRRLLKPNGIVYVRCHPWTALHAVHLAQQGLNKAFIHLFLTVEELKELGYDPIFTRNEKNPLVAYRWFFHDFIIKKENVTRMPISDFFLVPAFKELLINEQQIPNDRKDGFFKDMEIIYVDYILTLPE